MSSYTNGGLIRDISIPNITSSEVEQYKKNQLKKINWNNLSQKNETDGFDPLNKSIFCSQQWWNWYEKIVYHTISLCTVN